MVGEAYTVVAEGEGGGTVAGVVMLLLCSVMSDGSVIKIHAHYAKWGTSRLGYRWCGPGQRCRSSAA